MGQMQNLQKKSSNDTVERQNEIFRFTTLLVTRLNCIQDALVCCGW